MEEKIRCKVCGQECEGNLTIVDNGEEYSCCSICFNLWANQDYDKLSERLRK